MDSYVGFGHLAILVLAGLIVLAGLAVLAFCVIASIDILRRPTQQWAQAGQNQIVWIAVVGGSLVVGAWPVGTLLYWFIARPALRATERPTLAN